jgi:hypothetical protein
MKIFAGTARGIYLIEEGIPICRLKTRAVREIVQIGPSLFAGTDAGLYVSPNEGVDWEGPYLGDYGVWQVRVASDGSIYAGTHPAELFKSLDLGKTWRRLDSFGEIVNKEGWCIPLDPPVPSQARAIVLDKDDPGHIWVGVEVGGILRSIDGGENWSIVRPGDNPDLHMIFAHPEVSGMLFASTGYGRLDGVAEMEEGNAGVFRSDDYGESWRYIWNGIIPRYSRPMCIDHRTPFGLTVATAPTAFSSYKEVGGAQAMLYRSDDRGETWRSLCDGVHSPSSANFHGLVVNPKAVGSVLVGTDTGELWEVDKDSAWGLVAENMPAVLSILAA